MFSSVDSSNPWRDGVPRQRLSAAFVLAALLLAGCMGNNGEPDRRPNAAVVVSSEVPENLEEAPDVFLRLPVPPTTMKATYSASFDGKQFAVIEITSKAARSFLLGTGETVRLPSIEAHVKAPDYPNWRIHLGHGDWGRIASATYTCEPIQNSSAPTNRCPGTGSHYSLDVPDAYDAPSFLGLGPFLGTTIHVGETLRYYVWDPVSPSSSTWTTADYGDVQGRKCIKLQSNSTPISKTPSLLYPLAGVLVACDMLPVPALVQTGNFTLELLHVEADGTLPETPLSLARSSPPRKTDCKSAFPLENQSVLPANSYLDWASQNDPYIQEWLAAHPKTLLLPSAGLRDSPERDLGTIATGHTIVGLLLLLDPGSGTLLPRGMAKSWEQSVLLPPRGTFEPSDHVAQTVSGVPSPHDFSCVGNQIDLRLAVQPLMDHLGDNGEPMFWFVAPELGQAWQGSSPWTMPFNGAQRQGATANLLRSNSPVDAWPMRAYVGYLPTDSSVGFLVTGAADLSGWIRWFERNGEWP